MGENSGVIANGGKSNQPSLGWLISAALLFAMTGWLLHIVVFFYLRVLWLFNIGLEMTSELLLSRLKQTNYSWIRDLVSNTPLIAGLYRYFWAWRRKVSACRGIFRTFEAASASAPRNAKVGYSQQEVRRHKNPALLTARRNLGEFQPRDYPILIWLAHAFRQSNTLFEEMSVLSITLTADSCDILKDLNGQYARLTRFVK